MVAGVNITLAVGGGGRGGGMGQGGGVGEGLEQQEEPALPDASCAMMEMQPN